MVARRQEAWNPIRAEGSGEAPPLLFLPPPLPPPPHPPFSFFPGEGGKARVGREQFFPFLFLGTKDRKCGGGGVGGLGNWELEMIWKENRKKCSGSTVNY